MYLEYGNQNIWNISLLGNIDIECGNVQWISRFTFDDLVNLCKDSNGNPSYEIFVGRCLSLK